jgi:D-hexose-6-phosphate mutarotase
MSGYPEGARVEKGAGGLDRLVLEASDGAAHVYLHGGHVTHFQPRGERPVLWTSAHSRFEAGKPIRGGVPVCFPWFGPKAGSPEAPLHGFARILPWAVSSVARERDGALRAVLELTAEAAARGGFPHELALSLAVVVSRTLRLELSVRNVNGAPASFEEALHSYFAVADVRAIRISGLEGVRYIDKTAGAASSERSGIHSRGAQGGPGGSAAAPSQNNESSERSGIHSRGAQGGPGGSAAAPSQNIAPPAGEPIAIDGETDRVYLATTGTVTIEDPGWRRKIVVSKSGSATTVVWNPWIAKAKAMPDFGDDEWPLMVCVETANAGASAVTLLPGAVHVMTATIETRAL